MATERLIVEVSEKGALVVKRNVEDIGKGARKAEGGVQLLKRTLGLLASALIIRQLIGVADAFTNIQNRIRTVTKSEEELSTVTSELFSISNQTRQSFEATAEVYARTALAAKDLGISQREVLNFTKSLNQAVVLSGAAGTEAKAGLIQLSQGLASGTLRGDELRSVLEQLPVVADVIAKELGITRGELRLMGQDGKITADIVLRAFRNASGDLEQRFGKTVPTISQAFEVLKNNVTKLIGEFTTSSGAASGLAGGILFIANNVDKLLALLTFLGDVGSSTFNALKESVAPLDAVLGRTGDTGEALKQTFLDVGLFLVALLRTATQVVDKTLGLFLGLSGAIVFSFKKVPEALADLFFSAINKIIDGINKVAGFLGLPLISKLENSFEGGAKDLGTTFGEVFQEGLNQTGLTDILDKVITGVEQAQIARAGIPKTPGADLSGKGPKADVKGKETEAEKQAKRFAKVIRGLKQEAELLGVNAREREILAQVMNAEDKVKRALTQAEVEQVRALATSNQLLAEEVALYEEITGPQQQFLLDVSTLNSLLAQGAITQDQYNKKLSELKLSQEEFAKQSEVFQDVFGAVWDNAYQALKDFAQSGKLEFRDMASSILSSVADIIASLIRLQAMKFIAGALGIPLPVAASGADFKVAGAGGIDSQIVAFKATPGENVSVTTPGQQASQQGAGAAMGVTIINVSDPNEITDIMASSEGEQVILNVISKNRNTVKQAIA